MGNAAYHQANFSVPGWKKLSLQMKLRFLKWKRKSDSSWNGKYKVVSSFKRGKIAVTNVYQFEMSNDAADCEQWWKDYGAFTTFHTIQKERDP